MACRRPAFRSGLAPPASAGFASYGWASHAWLYRSEGCPAIARRATAGSIGWRQIRQLRSIVGPQAGDFRPCKRLLSGPSWRAPRSEHEIRLRFGKPQWRAFLRRNHRRSVRSAGQAQCWRGAAYVEVRIIADVNVCRIRRRVAGRRLSEVSEVRIRKSFCEEAFLT